MNNAPFISVVIITYNTAHLVGRAIDSVLRQTYRDFELIVVDDGSTDDTERLLAGRTDIRYLRIANSGVGGARNHGIAIARGQWIALLDSDDAWLPDKLEKQAAVAADPRFSAASVIFSDFNTVHEGRTLRERALHEMFPIFSECGFAIGDILRRRTRMDGAAGGDGFEVFDHLDFDRLFQGNCILPSSALLSRAACERFGVFKTHYRAGAEDTDMFLRWGYQSDFAYIDRPLVAYTVGRPGQQTAPRKLIKLVWTDIKLRRAFIRAYPEFLKGRLDLVNGVLSDVYARMGRLQLAAGDLAGARVSYYKARRHRKLRGRAALERLLTILPAPATRLALALHHFLKSFVRSVS